MDYNNNNSYNNNSYNNESYYLKKHFKLLLPALIIAFVLILGGSYAWFNYSKEGSTNKLIAGSLYLTMNEGVDTISLTSVFPETKEEARARDDNYITFTLSGKNTSTTKDINYEIKLNNGDDKAGKERYNTKDLVFDLVEVGDNNTETIILDAVSYDQLNDKKIWVDKVLKNTTSEIEKTYKLRMWLSEDVIISDTDPNADYTATGDHAYKNHYATVKVAIEGDMTDKVIPLTVLSNSTMVIDGETYITNTIENANSSNAEDTYQLTITSSNNGVEFVYDPTGVSLTNISNENISVIARPLYDYNYEDIQLKKVDNEIETTSSFDKTYTIANNKKITFNIILTTTNNHAQTTDLAFTLRRNNVVVQELVKHVSVLGKTLNVVVNVGNNVTYSGDSLDFGETEITYPDGTTYSGDVTYTYYSGSTCSGQTLPGAPTDAGTYCVLITVPATENSEETTVTRQITIAKANREVTLDASDSTYTGEPVAIGAPEGAEIKYYTDSACTQNETTIAPTYGSVYVKATLPETNNYNASTSECTAYTVSEATPNVTFAALPSASYTGTSQSVSNASAVPDGGGTITYKYYSNNTCTSGETTTAPTAAGTYYVKATAAGVSGKTTSASSECTEYIIQNATPTITLTEKTGMTYTGSAQASNTATVTLVNGETYSGSITYTYYTDNACTQGATTTAPTSGVSYVKATTSAFTNYNAAESECVAHRIGTASSFTITLEAKTGMEYNGSAQAANTATVSPDTGDTVTYTYYTDSACTQGATTTAPTAPGSYYVKASIPVIPGVTFALSESSCVAHTIAPKTLTARVTASSKYYDGTTTATCGSNVTLTGVIGSEQVEATVNTTGAFVDANVGQSKTVTCSGITLTGADATNYVVSSTATARADIRNVPLVCRDDYATFTGETRLYVRMGSSVIYSDSYGSTPGTLPTATKEGYYFMGWTTGSGGHGSIVIDRDGVVQPNVAGYTDSNGNFIVTQYTNIYPKFVEIWADNLSYSNSNSTGINCTGNNANTQCALDKLAVMLGYTPTPIRYEFGMPTSSSSTDYEDVGKDIFIRNQNGINGVCIMKDGSPECFNPSFSEIQHMIDVFVGSEASGETPNEFYNYDTNTECHIVDFQGVDELYCNSSDDNWHFSCSIQYYLGTPSVWCYQIVDDVEYDCDVVADHIYTECYEY